MINPTEDEQNIMKQILQEKYNEKILLLKQYVDFVLLANKQHNLIGKSTEKNIWTRHIIDSMQILPYIENAINIVDLGSGAGFPSIVVAICTNKPITLVEKSVVKANFLKLVAEKLNLNIAIKNKIFNHSSCPEIILSNTTITARAFKNLSEILTLINKTDNINKLVMLKGRLWQEEIKQIEYSIIQKWTYQVHKSIIGDGIILEMMPK